MGHRRLLVPNRRPIRDLAIGRECIMPIRQYYGCRALVLTQEEFAARYRIPLGSLRDGEQGRSEPDQPARAYLTVIARDPEGVRRTLEMKPG